MGGGKEEDKVMSPMFPRLHVNDADKGGPRAPPRNKMALYEQLSIPSQKFGSGSGSGSMLPLPPLKNGGSLIPSKSSNHGGGCESTMLTPFGNSSTPSNSVEKIQSNCSGEASTMSNQRQKFMKPINYQSSNATVPLPLNAKSHTVHHKNFVNFKNPSKRFRNDDDFRVPNFSRSVIAPHCSNNRHNKDNMKLPRLCMSSALQLQMASEKHGKEIGAIDPKLGQHVKNLPSETPNVSLTNQNPIERSAPSSSDKMLVDSSSILSNKDKRNESLKRAHSSLYQENRSSFVNRLHGKSNLHREMLLTDLSAFGDDNVDSGKGKVNALQVTRPSVHKNYENPIELQNDNEGGGEGKEYGSKVVREVDRRDDVSDASMVYCISAMDITPDDVVGVIGEKQFWKARRALVNQQRVFAVQVFELHRLIEVQKLIAGSPHLLLENFSPNKPSTRVPPVTNCHSEYVEEPSPLLIKLKNYSQKPDTSIECAGENAVSALPLPSVNNCSSKELITQLSNYGPNTGNPPVPSVSTSAKPSPWFFHPPPGNQWLVPVMSPSEGLVYKPYTGVGPPTAGFMAPVYSSCGPISLTSGGYGTPPSHQHGIGILPGNSSLGQTYFPPYVMPVMNPSNSGSAVEHLNPFARSQLNGHQSNMLSQMSRVSSHGLGKLQASKECDLQGSTASSPSERTNGDALPLFPVAPTGLESDLSPKNQSCEQQARVIKVVPHNPRSANESAARIFRTIQEERRQFD